MKFFNHLLNKHSSTADAFNKIQGYEDLKQIVGRALNAEDNYNKRLSPIVAENPLFQVVIQELKKLRDLIKAS